MFLLLNILGSPFTHMWLDFAGPYMWPDFQKSNIIVQFKIFSISLGIVQHGHKAKRDHMLHMSDSLSTLKWLIRKMQITCKKLSSKAWVMHILDMHKHASGLQVKGD